MNATHHSESFNYLLALAAIAAILTFWVGCTSGTRDTTVQAPPTESKPTDTDAPAPAADEAVSPDLASSEAAAPDRTSREPAPPATSKRDATNAEPPKPQDETGEQIASPEPIIEGQPQIAKKAKQPKPAAPPSPSLPVEIQPPATSPAPGTGPVTTPAAFPADLHRPQMLLTEAHAKTCLVKLGDQMPKLTLVDLEGSPQTLTDLYGRKLTVVVFWTDDKVFAREQFARLTQEVLQPFSQFGVNVVAVNVGDPPDVARSLAAEHDVDFPCLLDPDGTAFAQLATTKLPRTYLLDSQGTIRWFDIEYSQTTARELRNAIYYYLQPS